MRKKIKRREIISKGIGNSLRNLLGPGTQMPFLEEIEAFVYPIPPDGKIPQESLDPSYWEIPEGYYATLSRKED